MVLLPDILALIPDILALILTNTGYTRDKQSRAHFTLHSEHKLITLVCEYQQRYVRANYSAASVE